MDTSPDLICTPAGPFNPACGFRATDRPDSLPILALPEVLVPGQLRVQGEISALSRSCSPPVCHRRFDLACRVWKARSEHFVTVVLDRNHVFEIEPVTVDREHQFVRDCHSRVQRLRKSFRVVEPDTVELPRNGTLRSEENLRRVPALRGRERR